MNTITPTSTLPKIIAIVDCEDHGPCDPEPSAYCPHCGAGGRYIVRFICEDGKVHGAMKGCIQLYPRHRLAAQVAAVFAKQRQYAKNKWNLPSWDTAIIDACHSLGAGSINAAEWESRVRNEFDKRNDYHNAKYGGRRFGGRR
jgi:hypothetical protein